MKRIITITLTLLIGCYCAFGQTAKTSTPSAPSQRDSLTEYLDTFREQLTAPRYQLFPTHNEWTFLKLDTMTGKIWIVQYANNSALRYQRVLDDNNRVREGAEHICGRFTLYQAKRDWNFILLDTIDGRCWHVQWAMNDEMCNVSRIF